MLKRTALIILMILSLLAGQTIAVPAIAVDDISIEHGHEISVEVSIGMADANEGKISIAEGCDTVCGGCGIHHHLAQAIPNGTYLKPPAKEPLRFAEEFLAFSSLIYELNRPPKS